MAVGKSFLDQYSVFCVFGSVVGCVVVPLITQSVESLIFSAIVISLTANRFSKKVVLEPSIKGDNKDQKSIKCSKDKDLNLNACKKRKKPPSNNINGTQSAYHQLSPAELRRQQKEEVERREFEKLREMERKDEEKREKKLKKKEERLKRKNNEKKVLESKQTLQKDKLNSTSDKVRNGGVSSPKAEEKSPRSERTLSTTTPSPTYNTNTTTTASNMNSCRTKKYDYYSYRPNIPRFQRQAAKQRQMGYQQQVQPASWQLARSTPSPDDTFTGTLTENHVSNVVVPTPSFSDTSVIQPKVQSVIGCRKSPEPPVNGSGSTGVENTAKTEDLSGCYTLFGQSTESKDLVTIIRQETGLQKS